MQFVDTHCHIHDLEFFTAEAAEKAYQSALNRGVDCMLCIATSLEDSKQAITFAQKHQEHARASIGIHPHEAVKYSEEELRIQLHELSHLVDTSSVVAVGECGFDFYYNDKTTALALQEVLLEGQLAIAQKYDLPLSFHVREAFEDFWRVFEQHQNLRGVLHSFTDRPHNLERALSHGLKIGVNGIATFTAHEWQLDLFKNIGLKNLILETDSPFLTPKPKRGTINTPENVIYITNFLAELRGESEELLAEITTNTATELFKLT